MNKLVFEFDESMMTICLLANGWKHGWINGQWAHENMNTDYGGYTLKEAFSRLLANNNLYGRQFENGWKVK
jgi:hypothetical protein